MYEKTSHAQAAESVGSLARDVQRSARGIIKMERIQMEICQYTNADTEEDVRRIHESVSNILRHEITTLLKKADKLASRGR
jgi:hypothetical protein